MRVYITIDVEQDCPPFKETYAGISEGLPKLLNLFKQKDIKATFFTTGKIASKFPDKIKEIVSSGHELGCHGHTHERFDTMTFEAATEDLSNACNSLRDFYNVTSFRAPNLQFPENFLPILKNLGFKTDSTLAKHKKLFLTPYKADGITRLPVTTTSLVLRLNRPIRNLFLKRFKDPVVIFVHPWEFIDLQNEKLRFDCKWRTGEKSLKAISETIDFFKGENAKFKLVKDFSI